MKNKVLLVYPGLGKTYCAERMSEVLEIQLSQYKNLNVQKLGKHFPEHLKGNLQVEMKLNPDFPKNLLDDIYKGFNENKIVVMALKSSNIDFLKVNNIDFAFVIPSKDKIEELKNQYIERGNTPEYIERNIGGLSKVYKEIEEFDKPIYFIKKGCHLADLVKVHENLMEI